MKKNILILMALLCAQASAASGGDRPIYICKINSITQLIDSGYVKETPYTKAMSENFNQLVFDEATGFLRLAGNRWQMIVQQFGSTENSLVAIRSYSGLASSSTDVLRIRTFVEKMPFLLLMQDELYTGTCEPMD